MSRVSARLLGPDGRPLRGTVSPLMTASLMAEHVRYLAARSQFTRDALAEVRVSALRESLGFCARPSGPCVRVRWPRVPCTERA